MDPNKKYTPEKDKVASTMTSQEWMADQLAQFRSGTSNSVSEKNFLATPEVNANFAVGMPKPMELGTLKSDAALVEGAFGYVPPPKDDKDPNKPKESDPVEGDGDGEDIPNSGNAGINTAADNFKTFLGLGDPDRIEKRTEIKSARKANRATNRLRRAGETEYKDEDGKKTGEKIPTRKVARDDKKERIRKAKVKSDNKVVEKNK